MRVRRETDAQNADGCDPFSDETVAEGCDRNGALHVLAYNLMRVMN
jgi:hypothetical protein